MSDERLLALMVSAAGLAGAGAYMMRGKPVGPELWHEIHWPARVDESAVSSWFRSLAGDRSSSVVAFEIVATGGRLQYRVGLTRRMTPAATSALRSFVPGSTVSLITNSVVAMPSQAWAVSLSLDPPIGVG